MHQRIHRGLVCALILMTIALAPLRSTNAAAQPTDLVLEVIEKTAVLKASPSLIGPAIQTLGPGSRMTWNGTSQKADGRTWIQVDVASGTFWTSPDNQTLTHVDPTRITPAMDRSAVFQAVSTPLDLYQSPSLTSQVTAQIPLNTQLTVVDGPAFADLYTWWQAKAADGRTGWIRETTVAGLQVLTPLTVYGYNVCDNFNLKAFGVPGWDSIVNALGTFIPANEKAVCIGSTNLKGTNSPIVVFLTHTATPSEPHDTLRLFENQGDRWIKVHEQQTDNFSRVERLSLHDLTGEGKPSLVVTIRTEGTGGILAISVLRYLPNGGIQRILEAGAYKGQIQVGTNTINVIEADYKEGEPNCCPSGIHRMSYVWQNNKFVKVIDDKLPIPYALQGPIN